jgi:hypothetical protein
MTRGAVMGLVAFALAAQEPTGVPAGFRSYLVQDDRYPTPAGADGKPGLKDPRNRTAMLHDLVAELGLNPVVAVFSRATPTPDASVGPLLKRLDELPAAHRKLQDRGRPVRAVTPFVVFLALEKEYPEDEARDAKAGQVRELAAALKTPRVVYGLAAGKSAQAEAWRLADDAETVVVVYDRMQVLKRWDLKPGDLTDEVVKAVAAEADRAAGVMKP